MKPLKILVSAYACSPFKGSEPGVGWNFIKTISRFHVLHIISEEVEFRDDIEKYLSENPQFKNVTFHFIPRQIESYSKVFPPIFYFFYNKWQKKALKLASELDEKENFDIIHQLNFVGYREPGYLWKINKPFVWGPIGGMDNTAFKLLFNLGFLGFSYYLLRNIMNKLQVILLSRPKLAAQRSNNFLIAATLKNQTDIKKYWNRQSVIIPEVGQEENSEKVIPVRRKAGEPLKLIWSGQHTGGKALNILLKSLTKLQQKVQWQLTVLGDGKMTKSWKELAIKFNLEDRIHWTGWLPRDDAHEKMRDSHLMIITSLKDLTSTVILEALSFALPVVCIDHCGFSNVINDQCGLKIPISLPGRLTSDFAETIEKLYFDEELRFRLANGATLRAGDFSWKGKMDQLNQIYYSLV